MWCRHCKQDVAARRPAAGSPTCSRCQAPLTAAAELCQGRVTVSDCGVPLDAYDKATVVSTPVPHPPLVDGIDNNELRRLQRKLRPVMRFDSSDGRLPSLGSVVVEAGSIGIASTGDEFIGPRYTTLRRRQSAWGVILLLVAGGITTLGGLMLLVAANMLLHAAAWRWGFATATAGEALLTAGLAGMAIRLWRNSRRLNSQLELIDRRLDVVQSTIAQPAPFSLRIRHDSLAAPGSARGSACI